MDRRESGLTLVELLTAVTILSIIALAFATITSVTLQSWAYAGNRDRATETGRAVLETISRSIRETNWILLPFQRAPLEKSTHHVLCVALGVDNDGDGRVDEDSYDAYHDGIAAGVPGIDDDQDGSVDEGYVWDDDEGGGYDEEAVDGKDNDGDGRIDEDWGGDMSKDDASGLANFDDDGDGSVDEAHVRDDDEDGLRDEDPIEPLVYYVDSSELPPRLVERHPTRGETVLAENLYYDPAGTHDEGFTVTRIALGNGTTVVRLLLKLTTQDGEVVEFHTTVTARGCRKWPDWTAGSSEIPM